MQQVQAQQQTLVVSGGDELFDPRPERVTREAAIRRAELIAKALHYNQIDAYVPGPGDLRYGLDTFLRIARANALPLVASNVVYKRDGQVAFAARISQQLDGVPVVTFAVIDPELWPTTTDLIARPVDTTVKEMIASLPGDAIVLLVARVDPEQAIRIAQTYPRLGAVLVANANMVSFLPREVERGKTARPGDAVAVVAAGRGGEYLLRFDVTSVLDDPLLRGGAVFEDARETRLQVLERLRRHPQAQAAQATLERVQQTLSVLAGKTRYTYSFVELSAEIPEDMTVQRWLQQLPEADR